MRERDAWSLGPALENGWILDTGPGPSVTGRLSDAYAYVLSLRQRHPPYGRHEEEQRATQAPPGLGSALRRHSIVGWDEGRRGRGIGRTRDVRTLTLT
jgi:hypothetical protein